MKRELAPGTLYAVGLFDGEGCITTVENGEGVPYVQVSVVIASEEAVLALQRVWGGSVKPRSRLTVGGLRLFVWRVTGHAATLALNDICLHALVKKEQALLALRLVSRTRRGGGRGTYRLTDDERAQRHTLASELQALNGARSRFG